MVAPAVVEASNPLGEDARLSWSEIEAMGEKLKEAAAPVVETMTPEGVRALWYRACHAFEESPDLIAPFLVPAERGPNDPTTIHFGLPKS